MTRDLHDAHRELAKWLNEEQAKPIDRQALATVLWAAAQQLDARHAAPEPSEVCHACNGSKYSNRPWINLQDPGAVPPACIDCKTCGATGRVPVGDAAPQAQPAADLTDAELLDLIPASFFPNAVTSLLLFARVVLAAQKGKA